MNPKHVELINLELDGAASEAQRAELRRLLESSPEARACYEELGRLVRRLDSHPQTDPPAELFARIVSAVPARPEPRAAHAAVPGGFAPWLGGLFARPRLRLATTFGLGLAAGALIVSVVHDREAGLWEMSRATDPSAVSGTMVQPRIERVAMGSIAVGGAGADVTGAVEVFRAGSKVVAEVELESAKTVEWTLIYDQRVLSVSAFESDTGTGGDFAASIGKVRASHSGRDRYRVTFKRHGDPAHPFVLRVVQGGRLVFTGQAAPSDR